MKRTLLLASIGLAFLGGTALAAGHEHDMGTMAARAPGSAALSQGQVQKVDRNGGLLTIRHGPLENLGMPGMTMAFRVKTAAMLEQVKAGDAVRFRAEDVGGKLTVTELHVAN